MNTYIIVFVCIFIVLLLVLWHKNFQNSLSHEVLREAAKVSIFSEGKNYWETFEPIVMGLLKNNCPFIFYTMDKSDPIFSIKSDIFKAVYIGNSDFAFFKISNLDTQILISTTPNIGTKGYPIRKSPYLKSLIHVWHSYGDYAYAWYHKGSLDSYDEVLTTGEYMEKQIRFIEKKRNLPEKKITVCGVPYLDKKYSEISSVKKNEEKSQKTVLIAPSWGNKSLLAYYNSDFIKDLHNAGYKIILRPHPQSFLSEKEKINSLKQELSFLSNFILDDDSTGINYIEQADILISDTSAIRLDFAILYKKPVITLETPITDYEEYEYADLAEILSESTMEKELGAFVSKEKISEISDVVKQCIEDNQDSKNEFLRNKYTANFGNSGNFIADYIIQRKSTFNEL